MSQPKWDHRFLRLAKEIASWSKDPSTQVGAVIADPGRRVVSMGYNGLPQHIQDTDERLQNRDLKYKLIIHAERNALLFAHRDLWGATIYTYPFQPCAACASMIIQAGIIRVVAPVALPGQKERWAEEFRLAEEMFKEASVVFRLHDEPV